MSKKKHKEKTPTARDNNNFNFE